MELTLLCAKNGISQDNLCDLAADLNRRAQAGKPMQVQGSDGAPSGLVVVRAWVEGKYLKAEARREPERQ